MKFSLDEPARLNLIRGYAAGAVRIGNTVYRSSLIVSGDTLIADWRVRDAARLDLPDLEVIEALTPGVVLLGTGEQQVFPSPRLFAHFAGKGIGFEVMNNGAACRTYNVLVSEGRRAVCALILPAAG
jgi:uncharacterized protein